MKRILSFDIGGTSIKFGVIDSEGNILWKDAMDTNAHLGGEALLNSIVDKAIEIREKEEIHGVAVSTAGIINSRNGEVLVCNNIPNYVGIKVKDYLEERCGLKVAVENDVNCAALGERWRGAGADFKDIFCVALGTGVGGCIIANDRVVNGGKFCAGEVGFIKLGEDPIDSLGSTGGLIKRVAGRKNIDKSEIDGKMIFDLAFEGDTICIEEIDTLINSVAELIAMMAYTINPEVHIIGGAVIKQKEYLLPRILEKAKEKTIPYIADSLIIKAAELENDAAILGAAYNLLQQGL